MKVQTLMVVLVLSCGSAAAQTPTRPALPEVALTNKATVVSVIGVAPFVYIEALQDDRTVWLAARNAAVKKGDVIRYDQGTVLTNFDSRALKRVFPSMTFVNRVVVGSD
ncbi:MAG: hypothetical protein WDN04_16450 [Rhodospirillales bacterium]